MDSRKLSRKLEFIAVINMSNVSPVFSVGFLSLEWGPLLDQSLNPGMTLSGKAGSCFLLVRSLQCRTLTNCMYFFFLPFQLPIII